MHRLAIFLAVFSFSPVLINSLRFGDRLLKLTDNRYDDEDINYEASGNNEYEDDFALTTLYDTFKVRYILAKLDHPRLGKNHFKISYSIYSKKETESGLTFLN